MITHARVTTFTGSIYEFKYDPHEISWWVRAQNVPSITSEPIARDRWWLIETPSPWPPQHETGMIFQAFLAYELSHPDRLPGGGKWTSPVVDIQILASE